MTPIPDADTCYRAVGSRDARFDGWFFTAVRTTGIYCRPSCPAITPRRRNVDFYPSAAAAQRAGFRACKRCRPDAAPGSPDWDIRGDLAGRALRLIADGVIDREGVPGLARRLGYSERQVNRTLLAEVGAGPLALARAQRAQTARILLETTALPVTDIAFAAGFASVRQFNDTVQSVFATTPSALRAGGRRDPGSAGDTARLELRLSYREPLDWDYLHAYLAAHVVAGVDGVGDSHGDTQTYTRVLRAPGGPARVTVRRGGPGYLLAGLTLTDHRDLTAVVARVRRLLDLDADPAAVDAVLAADPGSAPLVARRPGLRSPGALDGFEVAVQTIVGQQVSVRSACAVVARIAAEHGTVTPLGTVMPDAETVAALDPDRLPLPRARGRAVVALAAALAGGELTLDAGGDRADTRAQLLALPGVGPWTADYLAMRLGDPDVLLVGDLAARRIAAQHDLDLGDSDRWRPWRSYLTHHLWARHPLLDRTTTKD